MRRAFGAMRPLACGLAALAIGMSLSLRAEQKDPDPDFSFDDTVKLGPFHAAPFLKIKNFGYDNNVRLESGDRSGDYTVTVGPGARAVIPMGRMAALSLWDEFDYVAYSKETELNAVNNEFRSKLHIYLRDFTLFADGAHRSFRERPGNEIDFRLRHDTIEGKFGVRYAPFKRGRIDLYADHRRENYRSDGAEVPEGFDEVQARRIGRRRAEALDHTETAVGFQGRLKIRPRTTLLFDARTGDITFDLNVPRRDSRTVSFLTGLEFDPSGPLSGSLKLGLKNLDPDDGRLQGYSGLVGEGKIGARIFSRARVRATFKRDTVFSTLGNNVYYVSEKHGLSYEHFLSRRFSVELGRSLGDNSYPEELDDLNTCSRSASGSLTCLRKKRDDEIVQDTLTFRYKMRPGLRIGLALGHWKRDSNFNLEDASRNTITTSLEYVP